jgi:hypothetical protein
MLTFLTLVSGLAWTVTYLACIRVGFRDRTYCMPAVPLALNLSWECVYAAEGLQRPMQLQTVVDIVWAVLDALILVTFLRYGRAEQPRPLADAVALLALLRDGRSAEPRMISRRRFVAWAVLLLAFAFALQVLVFVHFGAHDAARYSAFVMNAAMSLAFLAMAGMRAPGRGQSRVIAAAKLVGTLAATVIFGVIEGSAFVLGLGIACAVLDVLYLIVVIRDVDRRTPASTTASAAPAHATAATS